jgi:aminoglycoside phosphotransferase (APT) family kinase protein
MPATPKPVAEVDVTGALVRRLLADQHPDLADLPLVELAAGWDNVLFRLGDALVVRLPRRALSAPLVEHEQRWLPELAPRLPVAVPVPVRTGVPGPGFPWRWSVCPWIEGGRAGHGPAVGGERLAAGIGRFLRALHQPAPADAPVNPHRGGPLAAKDEIVRQRIRQLHDVIDADAVLACWDRLVGVPAWAGPPLWLHGDLHESNLVVRDGALVGVIDFGDITAGDPATDLSVAWTVLAALARPILREAAGAVDDDTWARSQAWALHLSLAYLSASADDPRLAAVGHRGLAAVVADAVR